MTFGDRRLVYVSGTRLLEERKSEGVGVDVK